MYCKKCGQKLNKDDKFCPNCGSGQSHKNKKALIFAVAAIVIIIVVIVAVILTCGNTKKQYSEQISLGDKYLAEMDYDNAEASYLAAIRIDEKQPAPYIQLSKIYVAQKQYEKAADILEEGLQKVTAPEYQDIFHEKQEEVEQILVKNSNSENKPEETVKPAETPASKIELSHTDKEMFANMIGELWWYAEFPVGDVAFDKKLQVMMIRSLLNEGRIENVKKMIENPDPSHYAVSEANMRILLDSLVQGQPVDEEYLRQKENFTYTNGYYSGPYADGEMAIYGPVADITDMEISGDTMVIKGFLHVSYQIDYAERFCKFEAELKKNQNSIFDGFSFVSLKTQELNREVRDITANTVLAPQSGNSYEPGNAYDQDYNTAWVEGVVGTGALSSITFSFDSPEKVYGISVLPGYWKSSELYEKNGYPIELEISFSDGSYEMMSLTGRSIDNTDPAESFEYIMFAHPVETSFVTVTITSAVSGAQYDDTCITEIQLLK